jgi:hypothetical protein
MVKTISEPWVFIIDPNMFLQSESEEIRNQEHPEIGFGGRALSCSRYEFCLNFAASKDWPGFHCENCFYKNRGFIIYYLQEFYNLSQEEQA